VDTVWSECRVRDMKIIVMPGKFPRGGFIGSVVLDGVVVGDAWGRTKGEARKLAKLAAEEMGLVDL
jgi:hypothetical protein